MRKHVISVLISEFMEGGLATELIINGGVGNSQYERPGSLIMKIDVYFVVNIHFIRLTRT